MKFDITAKSTGKKSGEILIYGYISDEKWSDDDVTAKDFSNALTKLGQLDNLLIRVNSYGGSVFAGNAIIAMIDDIRAKGTKVTSKIDGVGASMGSLIPQSADWLIMAANAMLFIHYARTVAVGNAADMDNTREMLTKADNIIVALYARRFKGTEDELRALLKGDVDGTWLTAQEALELGLCDEIDEPVEMAACAGGYRMNGIVVPTDALKGAADKIQIHETDGGENEIMIFNKELDAKIKALADEGKSIAIEKNGDSYAVSEMLTAKAETAVAILTAEDVQGVSMLEDASGDTVLAALKDLVDAGIDVKAVAAGLAEYKKPDAALTAKAEKFDALFASEVTEAIKNGVRAKGDSFKAERWTKILNDFSIDEVRAQSEEWANEADAVLHGGEGRLSRVPTAGVPSRSGNPEDYKF